MTSEKVITAKVLEVKASGAKVALSGGGGRAWLPAVEVNPEFKPHDDFRKVRGDLVDQEIEVIEYGQALDGKKLVSHIRVENDPWEEVANWPDKCVKVMEVTVVTGGRAIGIIRPGIRAQAILSELDGLFGPSWRRFERPIPGDEIAGWFLKDGVDEDERLVTLGFTGYIKSDVSLRDILAPSVEDSEQIQTATGVGENGEKEIEEYQEDNFDLREIATVLIVDDWKPLRESLGEFLKGVGCEVLACGSYEEATAVVTGKGTDLDLAIIDVHLSGTDDYLGMKLAKKLQTQCPGCPIIIVSGEEVSPSHPAVETAGDLRVCAFITKPFGVHDIYEGLATVQRPGKLLWDILRGEEWHEGPPIQKRDEDAGGERLTNIADRLRTSINAEAVVLFSIHPTSYKVGIVARSDPDGRYASIKPKLDRSPVRDAAIDAEEIFAEDAKRPDRFPKHRWLQLAYGYRSCIGINVNLGRRAVRAYGLFAFHSQPFKFGRNDLERVKLGAREAGLALYSIAVEHELRQMKPFELMGQAYGSLAHDLIGTLSAIDIELKNLHDRVNDKNYEGTLDKLAELKSHSRNAQDIVELFRAMAKGKNRSLCEISIENTLARAVNDFQRKARSSYGVSVRFIPYDGPRCVVTMPEGGLEQLVYNLLLNAAQQIERLHSCLSKNIVAKDDPQRYSRRNRGEIEIELEKMEDEEGRTWGVVSVHDNGPGIHGRDFLRIFGLHFTTKENGCGMGLDICRKIAEGVELRGQKGSLKVRRSILLIGSTFELRLPLEQGV